MVGVTMPLLIDDPIADLFDRFKWVGGIVGIGHAGSIREPFPGEVLDLRTLPLG